MTVKKSDKIRHQLKSRWYYIFWGAATVSVFAGQMYVGSGYRQMSRSFNKVVDILTAISQPVPRGYYERIVPPPDVFQDPMVVR